MVEHQVGHYNVKASIPVRNILCVNHLKRKKLLTLAEIILRGLDHAGGKIRESDIPAGRYALQVLEPEVARTTAEFEHAQIGRLFHELEYPRIPIQRLGIQALECLNTSTKVAGIFILLIEPILLVYRIGPVHRIPFQAILARMCCKKRCDFSRYNCTKRV